MDIALEVNKLYKKYDSVIALDDINFKLYKGETLTILGKSKSGKTSIVKAITGIIFTTSGSIEIFSSSNLLSARKNIGTMIEFPVLYVSKTAKENLEIHRRMIGEKDKNSVDLLLKQVGLSKTTKIVKQFSLQMRERMGIAMALMGNPPLVVLDEPFDEMSNEAIEQLSSLLKEYKEKYHTTFLITSRTLRGLNELTDRFIVLDKGKIVEECPEFSSIKKFDCTEVNLDA